MLFFLSYSAFKGLRHYELFKAKKIIIIIINAVVTGREFH